LLPLRDPIVLARLFMAVHRVASTATVRKCYPANLPLLRLLRRHGKTYDLMDREVQRDRDLGMPEAFTGDLFWMDALAEHVNGMGVAHAAVNLPSISWRLI
jgi:hypothetical protein